MYTRWGRTRCPTGATLVDTGIAAGTKFNVKEGMSDTLCTPETPQYLSTDTTATYTDQLNSVEYETFGTPSTPFRNVKEDNMPCAVCHTDTKEVVTSSALLPCWTLATASQTVGSRYLGCRWVLYTAIL